jgi:nicotinamide-nucleotide amidase
MDHYTDLSVELSATLGIALKENNLVLALAESCTGGLASAAVTEIAGSSTWFDRGFVTYSNASKKTLLSVPPSTITNYGAVSEETAEAMVKGALAHSHANIAASITGIAGPTGGSADKPVGTVCFAWQKKGGRLITKVERFKGSRQEIRHQAVIQTLSGLIDLSKA